MGGWLAEMESGFLRVRTGICGCFDGCGRLPAILLIALQLHASGCASIVSGSQQNVLITSSPPGARATVYRGVGRSEGVEKDLEILPEPDALAVLDTPSEILLERKFDYLVRFERAGFQSRELPLCRSATGNSWVIGNIIYLPLLFVGMAIAVLVDSRTGAAHKLDGPLEAQLTPGTGSPDLPPACRPS